MDDTNMIVDFERTSDDGDEIMDEGSSKNMTRSAKRRQKKKQMKQ